MNTKGISIEAQPVFVVSDIHGHAEELDKLLEYWNKEEELLVFLGDYCDRGEDSYGVFRMVKELVDAGNAVAIGGNHEELFISFLDAPTTESDVFFGNGGVKTIKSFYPSSENPTREHTPEEWAEKLQNDFPEIIAFIRELPFYVEMDDWLFVHAGINPFLSDWKETSGMHFRWIREMFYMRKNETGKRIMFGHTPIQLLPRTNMRAPIWTSKDATLIGIDGGMGSNRLLNGIRIQENEIQEVVTQIYDDGAVVYEKEDLAEEKEMSI